ncbi:hypothetical protein [Candidatus Nitrosotenuis sp. DW1]|uniref:hypothetical protein n=1 Tax=Candidatus Nitrosotenuis sp. DW1 TaxID=2259672 RepID=UPI0015CC882F|nr:hypothetical protein [Candidatus Nitrosotenuis sp. DW1]
MNSKFLIISVSLVLSLSTSQVFGCSKSTGMEVLLPWYEITSGDCSVRGYSISLSGIIYVAIGIIFVAVVMRRKRK